MGYTLGEAAKACRMSKAKLSKAVKSGKISATKNADGSFSIEAVELHRVYPITVASDQYETPKSTQVNTEKSNELVMLEIKLEAAHQRISDLETDKEAWRLQATRLLALSHDSKRGLFSRLFGK